MTNQTILITGASRGLGAAAANMAAKLGANVVINARSENRLNRVADEIRESGGEVLPVPGDVSVVEDCHRFNRVLASEETEITAITFRPGTMDTEMQSTIRNDGETGMPEETYSRYVRLHEEGVLLSPELPGRALAVLALYAPYEWSGEFIAWDEDRVQLLVKQYGMG